MLLFLLLVIAEVDEGSTMVDEREKERKLSWKMNEEHRQQTTITNKKKRRTKRNKTKDKT